MAIHFQHPRGTAARWTLMNPILMSGEMGIEKDTGLFKMGNGDSAWNALPYGGLVGATGADGTNGIDGVYLGNIDGGGPDSNYGDPTTNIDAGEI